MSSESDTSKPGPLRPLGEWPASMAELPRLGFVTRPAKSRAEAEQSNVLFDITSYDQLIDAAKKHFGKP